MKHTTAALAAILLSTTALHAQTGPVFTLDEIIFSVNASETEAGRTGNSVSVVTEEDLAEAGDLQLTEYLARLPGVSLSQNGPQGGTADIRIRGARGRYVSVYVDGILVTDPSGTVIAYEDFGGLTTGSIRRIEVLRGSQSALYGGTAVGGVINITTLAGPDAPEGTSQTLAAEAGSYNTYALSYGLTQRTGDLTLSLGLDHTRSDGFSAADENAGNTEADGFDRSRLSFGAEYEAGGALTLGVNGFIERGSQEFDDFSFVAPFVVDGTPDDEAERDTLGLRTYARFGTGPWEHEAAVSLYDIERRSSSNGLLSVFQGRRLAFDYTGSAQLSDQWRLSLGLNAQNEEATYANLAGGVADVDTLGGFVEGIWSPTPDIDVTGTLRYDDHSAFGGQATGRLAFAWRPDPMTVVRGAVGTGYRPPSLDELYGDYSAFFFVGNPDLVPEESLSAEVGIDREFANGASIGATLFLLEVENLVTYCSPFFVANPACPPVPGFLDTLFNVPGTSTRRGIEISGRLPISDGLTLTGAYTYTRAEDATGAPLPLVPEHDLVLGLDAELGNGWSGSLTAQHVAGTVESGAPLDDYTLIGGTLAYEVRDGVEAFLRVQNLLGEEYQTRRGYGTSDRAVFVGIRASF